MTMGAMLVEMGYESVRRCLREGRQPTAAMTDQLVASERFQGVLRRASARAVRKSGRHDVPAEDVAQAAALVLMVRLRRGMPNGYRDRGDNAFDGWLFRLTYRACLKSVRRPARLTILLDNVALVGNPLTPTVFEEARLQALLAIRRMPGNTKWVMWHLYRGMSVAASAKRLGVSANWISQLRS